MKKIISASLSPNTQNDDVWLAFKMLCAPWKWTKGKATALVHQWFETKFPGYKAISYNSGRSALLGLLQAFSISKGDEVLVQAFTCVAVPNSVLWCGATPVFVDIDETLNIDVGDAADKVTKKTRAIIVQHTLGVPGDMDKIVAFAKRHKLILIEDCAHSLGAQYKGKSVGSFGDAAFFSFGRDKVVSSVFGGMAMIRSKYKIPDKDLSYPSNFWILQQLIHPIAFWFILPLYTVGVGKILLVILQRLKLLSFPVYPQEKKGQQPADFPAKYPNAMAVLLLRQLAKLEKYNANRKQTAQQYHKHFGGPPLGEGSIFLRYPIMVPDPESVRQKAKRQGILLGNWYHNVIDPVGVDFTQIGYSRGSCPRAEKTAKHIVNLPTRISRKDAEKIITQCP